MHLRVRARKEPRLLTRTKVSLHTFVRSLRFSVSVVIAGGERPWVCLEMDVTTGWIVNPQNPTTFPVAVWGVAKLCEYIDMRLPKLVHLLPLVISLTTAPEGCASIGLLTQSTIIFSKAIARLRNKAHASLSGVGASLSDRGGGPLSAPPG